jgi:hypothetical protein
MRGLLFAFAIAGCSADGAAQDLAAPDLAPSQPPSADLSSGTVDAAAPDLLPAGPLDIPPRNQWPNAGGYCGETSIQSIGLFYGAWISQQVVRTVAGGELLLGKNDTQALDALHFRYTSWSATAPQPQFQDFVVWLKTNLMHGIPCIFAAYVTDGINDPDYDHIMPAVGIQSMGLPGFDPNDVLVFDNNFGAQLMRPVGGLSGTRATCTLDTAHGGCVPEGVDYGVAVSGFLDDAQATLPVSISVGQSSEPNVSTGQAASAMHATVGVSGLVAGQAYALLRFDDYTKVPTSATAAQYLSSAYSSRQDFTAGSPGWTWADPASFPSDGATYYRCIAR